MPHVKLANMLPTRAYEHNSGQTRANEVRQLRIENFKSFRDATIDLGRFNVVVGANASGKSNFVQAFRFFRDLARHGMENAVSLQGDTEFMRNIKLGASRDLTIEATMSGSPPLNDVMVDQDDSYMDIENARYAIGMPAGSSGPEAESARVRIAIEGMLIQMLTQPKGSRAETGSLVLIGKGGDGKRKWTIDHNSLSMPYGGPDQFETTVRNLFRNIGIYDINPRLSKRPILPYSMAELDDDGENLARVLKKIIENPEDRRRFLNLLTDTLGFVEDLIVEQLPDHSVFFSLRESFSSLKYLPSAFLSDGTIQVCALIIALYFDKKSPIILEEPERSIHPHLISKVIEMMKDVSRHKQIVITTHNPEVVKYGGLENLLLISRDEDGFSTIGRPTDSRAVQIFLENEMGLDELYVQNLLGA